MHHQSLGNNYVSENDSVAFVLGSPQDFPQAVALSIVSSVVYFLHFSSHSSLV